MHSSIIWRTLDMNTKWMDAGKKVALIIGMITISNQLVSMGEKVEEVKTMEKTPVVEAQVEKASVELTESTIYRSDIPLPKEQQEFLHERTVELGLDYDKTLAIIKHESKFDANAIGVTNDYGLFQINPNNHEWLAYATKTKNDPLDPFVNIIWGTFMLDDLYDKWSDEGINGQELDEYVWSSYNKGVGGFNRTGKATDYIKKVRVAIAEVKIHDEG